MVMIHSQTFFCLMLIIAALCDAFSEDHMKFEYLTCKGWIPYKDEKCVIAFANLLFKNYSEGQEFCEAYEGSLLIIDFPEKQKFVEDFIKSNQVEENVWLGLQYNQDKGTYQWADGTLPYYKNWQAGIPNHKPTHCIQLIVDENDPNFGKWSDELCTQHKYIVICEKIQKWSIEQLQMNFMNLRKNLVPVGYIHTQLPNTKPPTELWPMFGWVNVSKDYEGVFFRVEGKNSSSFGTVQEQSTERLNSVWSGRQVIGQPTFSRVDLDADGKWGDSLQAGGTDNSTKIMEFLVHKEEVRPRNIAVRLWKRIY